MPTLTFERETDGEEIRVELTPKELETLLTRFSAEGATPPVTECVLCSRAGDNMDDAEDEGKKPMFGPELCNECVLSVKPWGASCLRTVPGLQWAHRALERLVNHYMGRELLSSVQEKALIRVLRDFRREILDRIEYEEA